MTTQPTANQPRCRFGRPHLWSGLRGVLVCGTCGAVEAPDGTARPAVYLSGDGWLLRAAEAHGHPGMAAVKP